MQVRQGLSGSSVHFSLILLILPTFALNFYPQIARDGSGSGPLGRITHSVLGVRELSLKPSENSFVSHWPKLGHTIVPEPTSVTPKMLFRPGCLHQSVVRGWGYHNRSRPIRAHPGTKVQTLNSIIASCGAGKDAGESASLIHYALSIGL